MAPKRKAGADAEGDGEPAASKAAKKNDAKKKAAAAAAPERIEQTPAPRRDSPADRPTFKAVAWNVAGLRSLLEKQPAMLGRIAEAEAPDVICLQEHKLQEAHVADVVAKLRELLPDYGTAHFAVSTAKKGYSGVAVLARATLEGAGGATGHAEEEAKKANKKKQGTLLGFVKGASSGKEKESATADGPRAATGGAKLLRITEGFGDVAPGYTDEGRVITMEYDAFFLVLVYVPNSGQKLERLAYRLDKWDPDFRAYLSRLDATKPVIVGGDLNVGHLDPDIYNVGAPHIKKTAGLTPQERASWSRTLAEAGSEGLVDTFRHFHPDAQGWFTYWSGRAGNRPFNKGLRIDGFAASRRAIGGGEGESEGCGVAVVDGFILDQLTVGASDHAPIGFTLAL